MLVLSRPPWTGASTNRSRTSAETVVHRELKHQQPAGRDESDELGNVRLNQRRRHVLEHNPTVQTKSKPPEGNFRRSGLVLCS